MPWSKLRYRLGMEQEQAPRYKRRREVPPPPAPYEPPPRFARRERSPDEAAALMRAEMDAGRCSWAPGGKRKRTTR